MPTRTALSVNSGSVDSGGTNGLNSGKFGLQPAGVWIDHATRQLQSGDYSTRPAGVRVVTTCYNGDENDLAWSTRSSSQEADSPARKPRGSSPRDRKSVV